MKINNQSAYTENLTKKPQGKIDTMISKWKAKNNKKNKKIKKGELQSTNEELTTVNDELQIRNSDLTTLNDDLVNLLECVDIAIVIVDSACRIRRFTSKAGEMLNLLEGDIGRPISNINTNFDTHSLASIISEVIQTARLKEINVQDQEGHWSRLQVRPYRSTENIIEGAIISVMDINELKSKLVESNTSLDYAISVANTVHIPLVVLDSELRVESANPAFYTYFHPSGNAEGADLLKLLSISSKSAPKVRAVLKNTLATNQHLKDFEVNDKLSTSINRYLLLNGRRIKWIGSEPKALLLCIQDITDRIQAEKSLKEAIAAWKKADASKDAFLAMLSHELRTPLTAILCWAQLLLRMENDNTKLKHGLESIVQNSKIQGQLIDDLLDVTRIESGKLELNISQIEPEEVVRAAVKSLLLIAGKKSVTLNVHIKPLNGNVAADPMRLQQIIWNILINAIKFSPPHKIIDVYLYPINKQAKRFAAIQVTDHGKGIKADFLPKLFERFTQEDSRISRQHGGVGLGLTIARDLLKLIGGSISAESAGEGKGATFTILLPLITQALHLKAKDAENKIVEQNSWQNLHGLTIVLVEDELESLNALTELLVFAGAKVISMSSATEAFTALEENKPDILISDIGMPDIDGMQFIKKVRQHQSAYYQEIPALALTAYASKEDVEKILLSGFNQHLAKPFDAIDLISSVMKLATSRKTK